jgi:hypothetical protein
MEAGEVFIDLLARDDGGRRAGENFAVPTHGLRNRAVEIPSGVPAEQLVSLVAVQM